MAGTRFDLIVSNPPWMKGEVGRTLDLAMYFQDGFQRPNPFRPDVAVMMTGAWDLGDRTFPGRDEPSSPGDPEFDQWMLDEYQQVVDELKAVFGRHPVKVRASSKGNYVSVTARMHMTSSDDVLAVYREAGKVEGVISL